MKILGIGRVNKQDTSKTKYIVEITEAEADMITGVTGRPHISGRYKPDISVNISAIYGKVKRINERYAEIIAAAAEVKSDADDIAKAIPLA